MEEMEQRSPYDLAQSKIEILEVYVQPEDRAKECKLIAELLREAGEDKDAVILAAEYDRKAEEAFELAKQQKYEKALSLAGQAKNVSDYDRAMKLLRSVSDYKDAEEQITIIRKKRMSFIKKNNIKLFFMLLLGAAFITVGVFGMNIWLDNQEKARIEQQEENSKEKKLASEEDSIGDTLMKAQPGDEITVGEYGWKIVERDGDKLILQAIPSDTADNAF